LNSSLTDFFSFSSSQVWHEFMLPWYYIAIDIVCNCRTIVCWCSKGVYWQNIALLSWCDCQCVFTLINFSLWIILVLCWLLDWFCDNCIPVDSIFEAIVDKTFISFYSDPHLSSIYILNTSYLNSFWHIVIWNGFFEMKWKVGRRRRCTTPYKELPILFYFERQRTLNFWNARLPPKISNL
jgi:hypothetical protein